MVTMAKKNRNYKHGHAVGGVTTGTYSSWASAKDRCKNERNQAWDYYGGRGITMCEEWASDFSVFLKDMGEKPEGFSLERKEVNGNYEPGNCKWIPRGMQSSNTRASVVATYKGETKTLTEWAKCLKVNRKSLATVVCRVSKERTN